MSTDNSRIRHVEFGPDSMRMPAAISRLCATIINILYKNLFVQQYDRFTRKAGKVLTIFFATVTNGTNRQAKQPWHPDIFEFLTLKENIGPEEIRARDIFPALWMPNLFYKRWAQPNQMWSLFCPNKYPELITLYGEEFESRYEYLESQKLYVRQVSITKVWDAIYKSLTETSSPYILNKDHVNNKSNQKNIGPITSSNLCCEITEYHTQTSIAVCTLASICLPRFVQAGKFNFEELGIVTGDLVENLNNVISRCYYPVNEAQGNNEDYRPMGIGVQGLADVFAMMKLPWETPQAALLNQLIFETMYYHAVKRSHELGIRDGSYSRFQGSPMSQGILQCDMWKCSPITSQKNEHNLVFDWDDLRAKCRISMRNSLLLAPMPTASTSQIQGYTEAFEACSSNIFLRKVLSGNFPLVNPHLWKDLKRIGLWNKKIVDMIISNEGSIQKIPGIPDDIKQLYRTTWEIKQRVIADMSAARGAFVCQSQSLNISIAHPTQAQLAGYLQHAYKIGLKTAIYYLRTKSAAAPIKFSILEVSDPTAYLRDIKENKNKLVEKNIEKECTSCSA